MIRKIVLTSIFIFLITYCSLIWFLSGLILFPHASMERTQKRMVEKWGTTYKKMIAQLPEPTNFSVQSFDGTILKGKYFRKIENADCALIFAHGWTDTWAGMLKYVSAFEDCDCDIIMFNQRAHDNSGGLYATGGIKEAKDLLAVTNWLQSQEGYTDQQIGWVGSSWGAAVVLTAGSYTKNVGFIMADAPFQNWYSAIFERGVRLIGPVAHVIGSQVMQIVNWRAEIDYTEASALNVTNQITEPVLLLHSKFDSHTAPQQAINIAEKLNKKSTFHLLDWGGNHTHDVLFNKEKFKQLVNQFLRKNAANFLKERKK